jgi:predicted nuclease of predicted toxin-antitoxin system
MLDEHVSGAIAAGLRRAGIEAATVSELGRRTQTDADHLSYAREQGWVFFTNDRRVPAQARALGGHAGVVVGRDQEFRIGEIVRLLSDIANGNTLESLRSRVLYLQREPRI